MAHEHVWHTPLPTTSLVFDSCTYDLGWDGLRNEESGAFPLPVLPTLDYTLHLVEVVRFHCGHLFHLWDDNDFMGNLRAFYAQNPPSTRGREIWYCQFMTILAFGKAFTMKKSQGTRPPGAEFFVEALRYLPEYIYLYAEPMLSSEVLCCIALYLQCIDYRLLAYNYVSKPPHGSPLPLTSETKIGQALRMAFANGMHTDMPAHILGQSTVERSRRIWWTVYTLDQEMTSLIGSPQCMVEDDIHMALPEFGENKDRQATLATRIRLSRTIGKINQSECKSSDASDKC